MKVVPEITKQNLPDTNTELDMHTYRDTLERGSAIPRRSSKPYDTAQHRGANQSSSNSEDQHF